MGKSGEVDIESMVLESLGEELMSELRTLQIGKHHRVAEQSLQVKANWKLGMDTFGEAYHFSTVHPELRETLVPNTAVVRRFGKELVHSCMTLGRFTTKMMAA